MADTAHEDAAGSTTQADPLWDDWDVPPRVPGIPELHLAGFDGPMDLLLDLAERQRIDLGRISILQLAEQFIAAMDRLQRHVPLERRADWLVIASRLLLLRSRLLFPASPQAEADAVRDAGREARRLDQTGAVRVLTAWLDRQPQLGRDVFARPSGRNPRVTLYIALMEACLTVLRGREDQPGIVPPTYRPAPASLFRVAESLTRIRAVMAGRADAVDFVRCLPPVHRDDPHRPMKARSAVASSLLAVLELARGGEVIAAQEAATAPILLRRSDCPAATE